MAKILLTGGLVYDGGGKEGKVQDVLIEGDAVQRVAAKIAAPGDVERVDCSGLAVAPGFIDVHGHSDTACLQYPRAESRVYSGVTTEVSGNCGGSAFPHNQPMREQMQRCLGDPNVAIDWSSGEEYFRRVAAVGCSINLATLVGHGNLRAMTVGFGAGAATPDHLKEMARLLEAGMEAGAWGLSTGLIYPPGCYSSREEIVHLSKVVGRLGGLYASHMRSESRALLEAVGEFMSIIAEGGCRGLVSHVKTMNPQNWYKIDSLITLLDGSRARGLEVYCDRYPYLASWTGLDSQLFPDWLYEGGIEAELSRLRDPALRPRLVEGVRLVHPEGDWADRLMVVSVFTEANQPVVGLTLAELGRRWKLEPLDAAIRLLIEEEARASAVFTGMSDENLCRLLSLPYVCPASDASIRNLNDRAAAMSHPRSFGTPIRFLADYVRDKKLMTWGEGVRRLTGLPAEIFGWQRRGRLAAGTYADITMFKPDELADRSTYQHPNAAPAGLCHVLVAGQFVLRDGRHTGAMPGRCLRRGASE